MATRAVSVPLRWPAMRGKWRRCAQRPLPSMITARCFGSWLRFSFSSRNASSAVTAPSGWEEATWRVFGEEGSVTGLGGALLYRIKLTRHSGGRNGLSDWFLKLQYGRDIYEAGCEIHSRNILINSPLEEYVTTSVRIITAPVEIHATQLKPLGLVWSPIKSRRLTNMRTKIMTTGSRNPFST